MSRKHTHADAAQDVEAVSEWDAAALTSSDLGDEIGSLAGELARGYAELIKNLRRSWGVELAEAEEQARSPRDRALATVRTADPANLGWWTISQAMEHDPALALAAWDRVKDAARKELRSGHRTGQALDAGHQPLERARFLALRDAFREDWCPRGGIENALIDQLAESFTSYLRWTERGNLYAESECRSEDSKMALEGYWVPPRMGEARWMAWCAEQAQASHRRFLMTLKSLQDLRRLPAVSITSVGQLNLATQQINVSADADSTGTTD